MQFTLPTLLTFALAALTTAAPAPERRQFEAQLTFYGAADASYTLSVPTDASVFTIGKFNSSTRIRSLYVKGLVLISHR